MKVTLISTDYQDGLYIGDDLVLMKMSRNITTKELLEYLQFSYILETEYIEAGDFDQYLPDTLEEFYKLEEMFNGVQ
jgi:hypothetical protein